MVKAKHQILVVEDDRALAKALGLKLKSAGYDVVVCSNGVEALDNLNKFSFNLVFMDLVMPRMDGFTVLQNLKESKMIVPPIIILSNLSQPEDEKKVRDLGAKDFFVKSDIPLATIVEKVKEYIN